MPRGYPKSKVQPVTKTISALALRLGANVILAALAAYDRNPTSERMRLVHDMIRETANDLLKLGE